MTEKKKEKKEAKETKKKESAPKKEELLDDLKHVQADFENYRKRVERDKEEFTKFAKKSLLIDLIPLLDNFQLALENKEQHKDFVKGIELIYAQLLSQLQQEGVEEIETGDQFNPYEHEAFLTEESDKKEGTILKVVQKGYKMHGQVIRHAKVIVSK